MARSVKDSHNEARQKPTGAADNKEDRLGALWTKVKLKITAIAEGEEALINKSKRKLP